MSPQYSLNFFLSPFASRFSHNHSFVYSHSLYLKVVIVVVVVVFSLICLCATVAIVYVALRRTDVAGKYFKHISLCKHYAILT